jgi:hypothetical protein
LFYAKPGPRGPTAKKAWATRRDQGGQYLGPIEPQEPRQEFIGSEDKFMGMLLNKIVGIEDALIEL